MLSRKLCLAVTIAATAICGAQTGEKPKLSDDYAKAALKALVCISNGHGVEDALNDAEAAAESAPDNASLQRLKFFSVLHGLHIEAFHLSFEGTHVPQTDADVDRLEHEIGIAQDRACVAAWKTALRSKEAEQPKACDIPKSKS